MTAALDHILIDDVDFALLTEAEQDEYLRLCEAITSAAWDLEPRQLVAQALAAKVDWLLYGGAAGGGKTELALHHAWWLSRQHRDHYTLVLRETMPELRRTLILRSIMRFHRLGEIARGTRLRDQDNMKAWWFNNGSFIEFGYLRGNADTAKYLSAEYDCILVDEATTIDPEFLVEVLSRNRTTTEKAADGVRAHAVLFTNPGGKGHEFCYDLFVAATDHGQRIVVFDISEGLDNPPVVGTVDVPTVLGDVEQLDIDAQLGFARDPERHLTVAFVQSRARDNRHLDRTYIRSLNAIPSETRRKQLRDGDWDVFEGRFFTDWNRDIHVIEPFTIPDSWQRIRAIDWGERNPFCCLWIAWDPDGDAFVYREVYGAGFITAKQAAMVREASRSHEHPDRFERIKVSVADPAMWASRTGVGKSNAQLYAEAGIPLTHAKKNIRVAGWQNVRAYLAPRDDGKPPRIQVFSTCVNLIRTFPKQQHDNDNPEDMDTDGEDHALDALRYGLGVRPMFSRREQRRMAGSEMQERFMRFEDRLARSDRKLRVNPR